MINLVGSSIVNNSSGVAYTTLTGTMPSGAAAGMLLEAVVSRQGQDAGGCTPPAGWTTVANTFTTIANWNTHVAVFYKIADGADNLTFTMGSAASHGRIEVNAWSGFNASSPISIIGATADGVSANPVFASVTTTSSDSILRSVLAARSGYSNSAGSVVPSGFTCIVKSSTVNLGAGLLTGSAYKNVPTAGATGSVTWTAFGTGSSYWRGLNYAINPSAGTVSAIDDPITEGTTFNYTQSGMGTLSGITTDKTGVTVSGVTVSSATLSGWTEGGLYPELPTSVQFEFTGGSGSALKSSNISAPAGYTKLTIASPLFIANTLPNAILAATGRTVITGDIFYHTAYSDLVVSADGNYTVTGNGTFDLWLWVSSGADAGKMYYYQVTLTESAGVVISGGILKTKIVVRKLPARRI